MKCSLLPLAVLLAVSICGLLVLPSARVPQMPQRLTFVVIHRGIARFGWTDSTGQKRERRMTEEEFARMGEDDE